MEDRTIYGRPEKRPVRVEDRIDRPMHTGNQPTIYFSPSIEEDQLANDYKSSMNRVRQNAKCLKCKNTFSKEDLIDYSTLEGRAYVCKECDKTYKPSRRRKCQYQSCCP